MIMIFIFWKKFLFTICVHGLAAMIFPPPKPGLGLSFFVSKHCSFILNHY